jgi:hypothetical protein
MARYRSGLPAAWCLAVAVAATAHADPAFPDLDSFRLVDKGPYLAHGRGTFSVIFYTPDGLTCSFGEPVDSDPGTDQNLSCWGNIAPGTPLVPERGNQCLLGRVDDARGLIYHLQPQSLYGSCDQPQTGPQVLPAGNKISWGNITCAVGAGSVTACLDTRLGQRHGFVLQPSGSTAF